MENNAWFFGDSFTYGHGCNPNLEHEYHKKYPGGELWTTIVSDHFNCIENNLGGVGYSSEYIINLLISNLEHFQPNDIVIVGSSHGSRFQIYDDKLNRFLNYNPYHFHDPETNHNDIPSATFDIGYNDDLFNALKLFSLKYRTEPESFLTKYYDDQIRSLLRFIKKNNIRILSWGYHIWGNFETIQQATGMNDYHWCWGGHKQWASKCIELIERGREEFGTEKYVERDKETYEKTN